MFARIENADLVACLSKWKAVCRGLIELAVLDHASDIIGRGGKALASG